MNAQQLAKFIQKEEQNIGGLPATEGESSSPTDDAAAENASAAVELEATTSQAQPITAAPDPQVPTSSPEPREIDFPKFDLESKSEAERRKDADAMELPALARFIRPALVGIKRLVEAYRPYVLSFMERTAHQGEQKLLTNSKGEPADRDDVVREHLGVGVRRINQLLATTDPKAKPKSILTLVQDAVLQALVGQGYKKKEAITMVKAAEGEDFESLFKAALAGRAGKAMEVFEHHQEDLNDESEPAKEECGRTLVELGSPDSEITHAPSVPQMLNATAQNLKLALANEPDRDIASKLLTDYLQEVANEFANGRIEIKHVSATVEFTGRNHRIMPGDWIEKCEKTAAPTLCKCVDITEYMERRRVQEWIEDGWAKAHVIFNAHEYYYRVITEEAARKMVPEAFRKSSYGSS